MVKLTKGDWSRLGILCLWGVSWTPWWGKAASALLTTPWEALGAVATAAAAAIALWIATADGRERRRQRQRDEWIFTKMFASDLGLLRTGVHTVHVVLAQMEHIPPGIEVPEDLTSTLRDAARMVEVQTIAANASHLAQFHSAVAAEYAALLGVAKNAAAGFRATPEHIISDHSMQAWCAANRDMILLLEDLRQKIMTHSLIIEASAGQLFHDSPSRS